MRSSLGVVRLLAATFLLVTLVAQIVDLSVHNAIVPSHYFLFFTVESTILEITALSLSGLVAVRRSSDPRWVTVLAASVVPYAVVTALVYNLLLRGIPTTDYLGADWMNEVLHVAAPIYLVLDWFVLRLRDPGRARLRWRAIVAVYAFPVAWLVVTMTRGALDGWYPYPFLDLTTSPLGSVIGYLVGLFVLMGAIATASVAVTRVRRSRPADVSPQPWMRTL